MRFKHKPARTLKLGEPSSAPGHLADHSSGSRWRVNKQPNQWAWVLCQAEGGDHPGLVAPRIGSFGRGGGRRGAYHLPLLPVVEPVEVEESKDAGRGESWEGVPKTQQWMDHSLVQYLA